MSCFLGLECDVNTCPNRLTCYWWVKPWDLPYIYNLEAKFLLVQTEGYTNCGFEDLTLNLSQVWEEYGFKSAVELPYYHSGNEFVVLCTRTKEGFRPAWALPYKYEVLEDGCRCLTVEYNWYASPYNARVSKAGFLVGCPIDFDDLPF